jgi:hypothetical protein
MKQDIKIGMIHLSKLCFHFLCLYAIQIIVQKLFTFFYFTRFNSVAYKILEVQLPPPPTDSRT